MNIPAMSSFFPRFSIDNFAAYCVRVSQIPEIAEDAGKISFLNLRFQSARSGGIKKSDVKKWLEEIERIVESCPADMPNHLAAYTFERDFYAAALK